MMFSILKIPLPGTLSFDSDLKDEIQESKTVTVTGTVFERIKGEKGYSYYLSDSFLIRSGSKLSLHTLRINSTDKFIKIGTKIKAEGRLSFYEHASNKGNFDALTYYMGDDAYCSMNLKNYTVMSGSKGFSIGEFFSNLKEKLTVSYTNAMGSESGGVMAAMVLGDKSALSAETKSNYTVSGLSHLLAISGLHIGIIGAALLSFFIIIGIPKVIASFISVVGLFAYTLFTGASESTLRAFIMFTVICLADCILRSYDMLNSICIAGIILLFYRPVVLFRVGFLLSFLAVISLSVLYPLLRKAFVKEVKIYERKKLSYKIKSFAKDGFLVWLSVNIFTVPVVLYNFSETPVYGVFANILFVPMTELILLLGILGGTVSLILPAAAPFLLFIPKQLIFLQDSFGEFLRSLPMSVYITGQPSIIKICMYYVGVIILILLLKREIKNKENSNGADIKPDRLKRDTVKHYAIITVPVILMIIIFIKPSLSFSVTALDVGQGDCSVITSDNGAVYMIDGGSSSKSEVAYYTILPYLKSCGYSKINAVFISHGDTDHINGIEGLLELIISHKTAIRIERLLMPLWMKYDESKDKLKTYADKAGVEVIYVSKGDKITAGDANFTVLSPSSNDTYTDNEGSMVLSLNYKGFNALFTGDIEGDAELALSNEIGEYDYLKVAHHGSKYTSSEEFLSAVSPSFAVISAPKDSFYGHPAKETLKRLEDAKISWLQTGLRGAITVTYENGIMKVSAYKKEN